MNSTSDPEMEWSTTADPRLDPDYLSPYFIGTHPPLFHVVAMTLVLTFGIAGNVVIIYIYMSCKQLRTPSNMFIVNLALGDLTFLISSTMTVHNMANDGRMLLGYKGCVASAIIIIICATVSLITMALIAISRYMAIVHPQKKKWLSWKSCGAICVVSWFYALAFMAPTFAGWGRIGYHRAGWACTYDWSYNLAYNLIIFSGSQVLTSAIMVYCYAKIFWVFRQSKKRVAGEKTKEKGPKKEEIRLAIQLLVVFAIYNICWGPYFLVALIIDPLGQLSPWIYGFFGITIYWNSSVNILVYLYYNRVFRAQCFKVVGIQTALPSVTGDSSQNTASTTAGGN